MVYTYRQTITLKIVAKDLCDLVDTPKAMFGIQGCHFGSQLHLALFGLPLSKDHLTKSAVYGPTDVQKRCRMCRLRHLREPYKVICLSLIRSFESFWLHLLLFCFCLVWCQKTCSEMSWGLKRTLKGPLKGPLDVSHILLKHRVRPKSEPACPAASEIHPDVSGASVISKWFRSWWSPADGT